MPKYNILLKDDKGYSYIKITKRPWRNIKAVFQKADDGAEYLGPYTAELFAKSYINANFASTSCKK